MALESGKLILGIDPGTTVMGFSVLEVKGSALHLVQYGVLKLSRQPNHAVKLRKIFDQTQAIIDQYLPDEMAIEAQFFGKNVQSMLKLGRAQGVAIAAALSRDIPFVEYAPKKVKQSVTGNGNASKEQVARMVAQLLHISDSPALFDATDALSVALCHHYQTSNGMPNYGKSPNSWGSFLNNNPHRIK